MRYTNLLLTYLLADITPLMERKGKEGHQLADLSMWGGDMDRRGVSALSSSLHRGDISSGSRKSSWLTSLSDGDNT